MFFSPVAQSLLISGMAKIIGNCRLLQFATLVLRSGSDRDDMVGIVRMF